MMAFEGGKDSFIFAWVAYNNVCVYTRWKRKCLDDVLEKSFLHDKCVVRPPPLIPADKTDALLAIQVRFLSGREKDGPGRFILT